MIKRTLYFGNPAYLSINLDQLIVQKPDEEGKSSIPVEDIAVVVLDHARITITHGVLKSLLDNKVALISCDESHMPSGLMLPLEGNHTQSEKYTHQINASLPLKKNLWQQTVKAKIHNQMLVLKILGKAYKRLEVLEHRVTSGDTGNVEAQAAAYYWPTLIEGFYRERYGEPPNGLLNYGYAILRAMVARALLSSGLMPTLGIFHKNKYNAYCLADDIMEPYRPFVDRIVVELYCGMNIDTFLDRESKIKLLGIATVDAMFGKMKSPLMVGMSRTSSSLFECFEGTKKNIVYPIMT